MSDPTPPAETPRTTNAAVKILKSLKDCKSGDDFKNAEVGMTKSLLELAKELETENIRLRSDSAEVKRLRKIEEAAGRLHGELLLFSAVRGMNFDIPDEIWVPFANALKQTK